MDVVYCIYLFIIIIFVNEYIDLFIILEMGESNVSIFDSSIPSGIIGLFFNYNRSESETKSTSVN